MKDLGAARIFIGIEIVRNRENRQIRLHQQRYIESILKHFNMHESNGLATPLDPNVKLRSDHGSPCDNHRYQSQVGKLMYAMLGTRPDLAYAVSTLGRFNSAPTTVHASAVKRTLRYLSSTRFHGLLFDGGKAGDLTGYSDSDWAGDLDTRRSTSGYVFLLAGAAISWKSRRQPTVALSSTEAEYMAIAETVKEAIWLRRLFSEITQSSKPQEQQLIYLDNSGAKDLAHNPKHHDRTKHIDIRYHYIRDCIENKAIRLEYVNTASNTADILTKALPRELHERHTTALGIRKI